jgi:RimJ/RimL family protein N-acetyltransferase
MNLVYGHDAVIAEWVRARAPHADNGFEKYTAIGVEHAGEIVAGCVYNEYRGHSMHVSIASATPRWATRKTLRAFFGYPFLQLQVKRLTAYTGKSMSSVRRFLERLGFVQEGVLRSGFADDDCVVYGMLREECRWI